MQQSTCLKAEHLEVENVASLFFKCWEGRRHPTVWGQTFAWESESRSWSTCNWFDEDWGKSEVFRVLFRPGVLSDEVFIEKQIQPELLWLKVCPNSPHMSLEKLWGDPRPHEGSAGHHGNFIALDNHQIGPNVLWPRVIPSRKPSLPSFPPRTRYGTGNWFFECYSTLCSFSFFCLNFGSPLLEDHNFMKSRDENPIHLI